MGADYRDQDRRAGDVVVYQMLGALQAQQEQQQKSLDEIAKSLKVLPQLGFDVRNLQKDIKDLSAGPCTAGTHVLDRLAGMESWKNAVSPTIGDLQQMQSKGVKILSIFGVAAMFLGVVSSSSQEKIGKLVAMISPWFKG